MVAKRVEDERMKVDDVAGEHAPGAPPDEVEQARGAAPETAQPSAADGDTITEVDVLRRELKGAHEALEAARSEIEELKDRVLRARADLDNARKRAGGDVERAFDAGLDAAIHPVLVVYDDLTRALQAAEVGDPASIVPGVRSVRETLERQLSSLGIERVGEVGETFDPDRHEALSVVPADGDAKPGTVADVFEAGFMRSGRLVRAARVVVYDGA
jgi:molecular chaperone GrpE